MRNIKKYSRVNKNNIEMSDLSATKDECVISLLKDVGAAVGVQVQEGDISVAHRVPSNNSERGLAIIEQFTNRAKREEWISKYRQKKTLTAKDVKQWFPKQRVYIKVYLSPEKKMLVPLHP